MDAAADILEGGNYVKFRQDLIPRAPFTIAPGMMREIEFAERRCRDIKKDRLFPYRFLLLFEGVEQRRWGIPAGGRSHYHPEALLEFWNTILSDPAERKKCEDGGFRFDFEEKAVEFTPGWIYIGDTFIEDFLEIEALAEVELLFTTGTPGEYAPVFTEYKQ